MGHRLGKLKGKSISMQNTTGVDSNKEHNSRSSKKSPLRSQDRKSRSVASIPSTSKENVAKEDYLAMKRYSKQRSNSNLTLPSLSLTMMEQRLVQRAWKTLQQQNRVVAATQDTFQFLCFRYPEIKRAFAFDEVTSGSSEVRQAEQIKLHAVTFADIVGKIVANFSDQETVQNILMEIGRRHANGRRLGFNPSHLDQLSEIAITKSKDWVDRRHRSPDFDMGWAALVVFMVKCLKDGYYQEGRRLRRESRLSGIAPALESRGSFGPADKRSSISNAGTFIEEEEEDTGNKQDDDKDGRPGTPKKLSAQKQSELAAERRVQSILSLGHCPEATNGTSKEPFQRADSDAAIMVHGRQSPRNPSPRLSHDSRQHSEILSARGNFLGEGGTPRPTHRKLSGSIQPTQM